MTDARPAKGVWHCWCEHDGCDWEREFEMENHEMVQEVSGAAMVGHGLDTGHHETKREKVS